MALTAAGFRDDSMSIASNYVIIVAGQGGIVPPAAAAGRRTFEADDCKVHYTFGAAPASRTMAAAAICADVQPDSLPCYFLPWAENEATVLTLPPDPGGPVVFMTATLSGCTVQVSGTAEQPTIVHANAKERYSQTYETQKQVLETVPHGTGPARSPQMVHEGAEARANAACTAEINRLLPAVPLGAGVGRVGKSEYAGRFTKDRLDLERRRFEGALGHLRHVAKFDPKLSGLKPQVGAFVWGLRGAHDRWSFYWQAAVDLYVVTAGPLGLGKEELKYESAVLGPPTKFFPP